MTEPKILRQRRRRKQKLLPKVREWRRKGFTFEEIAVASKLSIRTVWLWCKDVPRGQEVFQGA
jgi:hypothetical protein